MIGSSLWMTSCGALASISSDGNRGVAGGVFNLNDHIETIQFGIAKLEYHIINAWLAHKITR